MSAPVPAVKRCTKCGETKNLADFHRNRRTHDGRASACKPCALAAKKEFTERRLAEDPDAERERSRMATERSRQNPEVRERGRRGVRARRRAISDLIAAHREEFDLLVKRRRYEAGL